MDKLTSRHITHCIRCGTCCKKGGPVLHHEDKKILRNRHAAYEHLVTIRKGELTYNPLRETVEQAYQEMVKVAGKGDTWSCCFYREEDFSCMIYEYRFLECRLLKCWEPAELMRISGQHTIRRSDIINHNDPVLSIIEKHCYVARFLEGIYVLHGFEKRTRKTSRSDLELARTRYREFLEHRRRQGYGKG